MRKHKIEYIKILYIIFVFMPVIIMLISPSIIYANLLTSKVIGVSNGTKIRIYDQDVEKISPEKMLQINQELKVFRAGIISGIILSFVFFLVVSKEIALTKSENRKRLRKNKICHKRTKNQD